MLIVRQSLTELEMAKRNFSSTYVAEVMKEVAEYVPSVNFLYFKFFATVR